MPRRYRMSSVMTEDSKGNWVSHSEYAKLQKRCEELETRVATTNLQAANPSMSQLRAAFESGYCTAITHVHITNGWLSAQQMHETASLCRARMDKHYPATSAVKALVPVAEVPDA